MVNGMCSITGQGQVGSSKVGNRPEDLCNAFANSQASRDRHDASTASVALIFLVSQGFSCGARMTLTHSSSH